MIKPTIILWIMVPVFCALVLTARHVPPYRPAQYVKMAMNLILTHHVFNQQQQQQQHKQQHKGQPSLLDKSLALLLEPLFS